MHDHDRTGLCRHLRTKPSNIKQALLATPPTSSEPAAPNQANPQLFKRRRRKLNKRQRRRAARAIAATRLPPSLELPAPGDGQASYFSWWKNTFFGDEGAAP